MLRNIYIAAFATQYSWNHYITKSSITKNCPQPAITVKSQIKSAICKILHLKQWPNIGQVSIMPSNTHTTQLIRTLTA